MIVYGPLAAVVIGDLLSEKVVTLDWRGFIWFLSNDRLDGYGSGAELAS